MARMYIADKPTLDLVKTTLETTTNTNISTALTRLGTSSSSGSSTIFGLLNTLLVRSSAAPVSVIKSVQDGHISTASDQVGEILINHAAVNVSKSFIILIPIAAYAAYILSRESSRFIVKTPNNGGLVMANWTLVEFN